MNDKLTLSINARDLLNSQKFTTVTSGDGFWQDSESWRGGRRIGFTLTFNFGNMNSKKKNKDRDNNESQEDEPEMMEM